MNIKMKHGKKKGIVIAFILATAIFTAGCTAGSSTGDPDKNSNGGIPTQEQIEAAKSELGDDAGSLKFSLNGTVYQYPFTVQTMIDDGWYIEKSVYSNIKKVPGNTRTTTFAIQKKSDDTYGAAKCQAVVSNNISMECALEELKFYTINIKKEDGATLILPLGITWNSTFEEVKDAYKPMDDYFFDGDNPYIIVSGSESREYVMLYFDTDTRTLKEVKYH